MFVVVNVVDYRIALGPEVVVYGPYETEGVAGAAASTIRRLRGGEQYVRPLVSLTQEIERVSAS